MPSASFINNSNPASFGAIPKNAFFYDFGFKSETNSSTEGSRSNSYSTANFSNIGIAFPISEKSGFGVTLIPLTSVGYNISGIESSIEGSTDIFITEIEGEGGINDLKINYGYAVNDRFRLGVTFSALFGKITERETNYILTNSINSILIEDDSYYKGVRFGAGFQYDLPGDTSFGGVVNLPTNLSGDSEGTTTISTTAVYEVVETDSDLNDFKLPLEIGFGFQTKLKKGFTASLDYKKSFWDLTDQTDQVGTFVDQNFFGAGLQFKSTKNQLKFLNRLEYRAGFNYDDGSIEIENNRISNSALNLGIGIPLRRETSSMINVSYSYGSKGTISDGLIKENYHLLSVNLSLEGIWFKKRKIF
jgi:long-subunit fatty acid transport protein